MLDKLGWTSSNCYAWNVPLLCWLGIGWLGFTYNSSVRFPHIFHGSWWIICLYRSIIVSCVRRRNSWYDLIMHFLICGELLPYRDNFRVSLPIALLLLGFAAPTGTIFYYLSLAFLITVRKKPNISYTSAYHTVWFFMSL